jgi:hypothetical protein
MKAEYGGAPAPRSRQAPDNTRLPSARSRSASAVTNRVLPIPAGPLTVITPGSRS